MLTEYLKAVIYGIIEGITEWLPISSTGHLILLDRVISPDAFAELGEQYSSMFNVVIQLGAMLAVVFLYRSKLFLGKGNKGQVFSVWKKLVIATVPAGLIGVGADFLCKKLAGRDLEALLFCPEVVASALIVYGIFFILVECLTKNGDRARLNKTEVTNKSAFAIGCFQALAIIPGTSRSGATILGARIMGIERSTAAEFSFLAAVPVISAASFLKTVEFASYSAREGISVPPSAIFLLLTAGTVAFLVSLAVVKGLTALVRKHSFTVFGIYRILLGAIVLFFN